MDEKIQRFYRREEFLTSLGKKIVVEIELFKVALTNPIDFPQGYKFK